MPSLNALFEQFLRERRYLKNVSPKTQVWYETAWATFLVSAHLKARKSGRGSTESSLRVLPNGNGGRRAMQALGGRRDHSDAREQRPPSAPSRSRIAVG
jgi:hypothetical protein